MPGVTVKMDMWATAASLVVGFLSVGWWSSLGDRRGRKSVLGISILGALFRDLIYLVVARTDFQKDGVSVALIVDGLLGGFSTFNGVAYAYVSDVSTSSLSRTVNFGLLQAVAFISFRAGAFLGLVSGPADSTAGFAGSVFLGCYNLVYIYVLLPESLVQPDAEQQQKSTLQYIFSTISVFQETGRKQLVLLASSIFLYSCASAFGVKMEMFTSDKGYFASISKTLLLIIPSAIALVTWLGILPALAVLYSRQSSPATEESGALFAKSVAQNSLLVAVLCVVDILTFSGTRSGLLYPVAFFLYPFTVGALPALFSQTASYFIDRARGSQLGLLFGALAFAVSLGEFTSFYNLPEGVYGFSYDLEWAATFLVTAVLLLVLADGPRTHTGVGVLG
ncbi:hypothetical protein B0H16DRAFT_1888090 [Mycena metata]|uniref:Uncharacterized protein n=1 Tax=Mycena metata TaxID=1033252 RepID=A0AAD7IT01_9AGAR|nr:hypothetical protein B0H16DRAFT_1888090 [Mycena metata]